MPHPTDSDAPSTPVSVDSTERLLKAIFGEGGAVGTRPRGSGEPPDFTQFAARLGQVETKLGAVEGRLAQVETKLAVVETKLGSVEAGQTRVEAAVLRLQDNARIDFRLVFGAVIAVALGLAGMMAHGFHWI